MYLEGLNLTGIPAIVLLPAIGLFVHYSTHSFMTILGIAILGSMLGNITYYVVVRYIGPKIYNYFYNKLKGIRKSLEKPQKISKQHGSKVCLIGRIIPGVRTVVSLLAGTFEIQARDFIVYSFIGVSIWNLLFILVGYLVGTAL